MEIVKVVCRFHANDEFAFDSSKLGGAGLRYNRYRQLLSAFVRCAAVLQDERSFAAVQFTGDLFQCNIPRRPFDRCHRSEHFHLAGAFQITGKRLIDGHAAHRRSAFQNL